MNFNKIMLGGTLGRDPETKTFPNGGTQTTVTLVTNRIWVDRNTNTKKETPDWHKLIINGAIGTTIQQYFRKGDQIFVEGSLYYRSWEDQHGTTRISPEIHVDRFQFVDRKTKTNEGQPSVSSKSSNNRKTDVPELDDDLPF